MVTVLDTPLNDAYHVGSFFLGLIIMDEGKNLESSVNINYIFNKWNLMFRKNGIIFFRTLMVKAQKNCGYYL